VLLLSEQCRVKLTAGRFKSQGGVDGIEDVITSLFLKPTACRSPETRIGRGGNWAPKVIPPTSGDQITNNDHDHIWITQDDDNNEIYNSRDKTYEPPRPRNSDQKSNTSLARFGRDGWELYSWQLECVEYGCAAEERREVLLDKQRRSQRPYPAALVEALRRRNIAMPNHMCKTCFRETTESEETTILCCGRVMCAECVMYGWSTGIEGHSEPVTLQYGQIASLQW